ncbi:MAG: glycosyl hydrolase family 28 protein [Kiritimatiellaeota bacterium]|nr:glycosyl hydrolase family 28 protein [Kiritimatiellota bacterium]
MYTVDIDDRPVVVHAAPVRAEILEKEGLWSHRPDYASETAEYVLFDVAKPVTVTVKMAQPFTAVTVLPESAGIVPTIGEGSVTFVMDAPKKLTLLCDGNDSRALHLFGGKPLENLPDPKGERVIYFGPGVHTIEPITLKSNETLFIDEGAYLKVQVPKDEKGTHSEQWKVMFLPGGVFNIKDVENVRICGRGIVDATAVPHPGYPMIEMNHAKNVRIENVTLINSANWNFVMGRSSDIRVDDVRIVSGRLNSDGVNTVNSTNVHITDCFVRNSDDSIVVKTVHQNAPAGNVLVEDCVIWNDWGYALGVSYETRSPIKGVHFRNNAIIYATHWCFGCYLSDSATVEDIRFENTEISALPSAPVQFRKQAFTLWRNLINFGIAQDCWGHDAERGRIRNVTIDGVTLHGDVMPNSNINGADADHDIQGVTIRNVTLGGRPVTTPEALKLHTNAHVSAITM